MDEYSARCCCAACGQETEGSRCSNAWCWRADRGWSVVYSAGIYEGALRRGLVNYKYRGQRARASSLARLLADYLDEHATWFEEYDLVGAVPAYTGPGARRMWDPVGGIVHELAGQLGPAWEVQPGLVEKIAETEPMRGLSQWERVRSAEGSLRAALRLGSLDVTGARILVVDDVFTEGSTLREVVRLLCGAGAEEVAGLVVARPPRPSRWVGG